MKWSLFLSLFIALQLSLALSSSVKRNKNKDEDKNNSINYYYKELVHSPGSLITSMLHDATLPVFFVMGAASIASILTNSGKNEGQSGVHGRIKRSASVGSSELTQSIVKVLNNVQKAIEQYSHIEEAILNDLDDNAKREFAEKSSD